MLKLKDLQNLLPFTTFMYVMRVTGAQLLAALQAGVSGLPALEGRFPQVSGIRFVYRDAVLDDSGAVTEAAHVVADTVFVDNRPLDLERSYLLAVPSFIGRGKDGYDVLAECEVVKNEAAGFTLNAIALNFFRLVGT